MKSYITLEKEIEKINLINNVIILLYWDIAVNMQSGSAESRKNEIVNLTLIAHSMLRSNKIVELMKEAFKKSRELNAWQLANLHEIEKKISNALCIDDDLLKRFVSSTTQCELIWRKAKLEDNYAKLKPYLQSVLDCVKEIANIRFNKFNHYSKYDALIDVYDPNSKTTEIKKNYAFLKEKLPNLIQEAINKQKSESFLPVAKIGIEQQKLISQKIVEILGFDFTRGRIDESVHPFCRGSPDDIRLTTKYYEDNFLPGIMASMHEAGHGLYEQNLPVLYRNQFVGKARSMSIHESQSLLMEVQIGKSKEFMEFFAKLLRDDFNLQGKEYSSENLYKMVTRIKPNFIRIHADEVTYPMHVILRFEIEEALINNEITLDELPVYWNQKMYEYFGVIPPSNREGCLQDIHWSLGDFGYFPSYTNGAIIASMLMHKIQQVNPNLNQEITRGEFKNLNHFLNLNVRSFGSFKKSDDLMKDATGEEKINPVIFLKYLEQKYLRN